MDLHLHKKKFRDLFQIYSFTLNSLELIYIFLLILGVS